MNCIICGSDMGFFFTKTFSDYDLTDVDYWKCPECGFCASKTHFDMTDDEWSVLNTEFHVRSHHAEGNPYNRNQRYFDQAMMLFLMVEHDLIERGEWLDWGSGVGSVAMLLEKYFQLRLMTYDRYFTPDINAISEQLLSPGGFDLVVNTGVFEHVRDRQTLDEIESYVGSTGCLAVHTLVPESVPRDPAWMYLLPVHCAFHTNRSMGVLMDAWGYSSSVYNEHSKMWILFRQSPDVVEQRVTGLNQALGWEYLHFSRGFMDYWR